MKKFLVIGILAVFAAAWAQAPATGTVNGSVTLNGNPVTGASVEVGSSGDSSYTAKVTSDTNGNFSVSNAPLGTIEAKAYDSQGQFLASSTGTLAQAGGTLSLTLAGSR
jgi:hypothetical protein